jgi:uncharacterized protein
MTNQKLIQPFLDQALNWCAAQAGLRAVLLVGSYARGTARCDSDVDLVLIVDSPRDYIEQPGWLETFGVLERWQVEDYGMLTSLRAWYTGGLEVEWGITSPGWAALPLDAGTSQVLENGCQVLLDRGGLPGIKNR